MSQKNLISFNEIAENDPNFLDTDEYTHWASQFDNDHPLNLEIGFGNGSFLIEMAIQNPDINFIGMDFYHKGIRKTITRIGKLQLKNVRLAYGDARERIPFLFREQDLQAIYINFPDPWPKARHARRRLIQPSVVADLCGRLRPGGHLFAVTDDVPYAEQMHETLAGESGLDNVYASEWLSEVPGRMQTAYESEWRAEGRRMHFFAYRRRGVAG